MARIAVVGNATQDLNRTADRLFSARRPGGTLLYASLALAALDHDVVPVGHAPLQAYRWLQRTPLPLDHVRPTFPGTQFLNEYDGEHRRQWARRGPPTALSNGARLEGLDGVLLGPVLGEVPATLELPARPVSLLDLQGSLRALGPPTLLAWKEVHLVDEPPRLPRTSHVRGALEEARAITGRSDPQEAARALHDRLGAPAVVTLGSEGAVAVDREGVHRATPEPLAVQDPTGAGDVFDAGLLHGLLTGVELPAALAWGCGAAGVFLQASWDRQDPLARFGSVEAVAKRAEAVHVQKKVS